MGLKILKSSIIINMRTIFAVAALAIAVAAKSVPHKSKHVRTHRDFKGSLTSRSTWNDFRADVKDHIAASNKLRKNRERLVGVYFRRVAD